ncbi:3-methyl-2-oxobutanoate hydroxymethyltransferase [Microbacterium invictum]|uniref:3-methyl-2-oxobutanoate hydroxymethyltransferase n=1 Tax=Microbacterium invictum TaxID=515415 RepID=A0AA40SRJ3_9MICO|nr:3-methyl-2-oxobutanoate hydroxymethyltransferase [Microbacterium invictum]MBB4141126.1 3-methyl-2-oxobutanoate hydroxymethyltransferase [Microbacterium invictum]
MNQRRFTVDTIAKLHAAGERFTMVTAYDFTSARIVDRSEVELILVGDSLGMVMQGHDSTLPVTVDDMIYHTRMVMRGAHRPLVVTDLPFGSYTIEDDAIRAATRVMAEGGSQAVKLEGGAQIAPTIRRLVDAGIPVMAHVGFTPQSVHAIGMRTQGRQADQARRVLEDALAVQDAGAWAVVLELIPAPLAAAITERLEIPTIGIGAGPDCSGQVQVWHDLLGLYDEFVPRHAHRLRTFADDAVAALDQYAGDVREGAFPTAENSSTMDAGELARALGDGSGDSDGDHPDGDARDGETLDGETLDGHA